MDTFRRDADKGWRDRDAYRSVSRLARRVDTEELLEWLGALALDPRNGVAQMVLEAVAHVVIATVPLTPSRRVTESGIRRLVGRGFQLLPSSLDPPEQPFSTRVLFRQTASTTPLGLVTGCAYDLARTLEIVGELAVQDADGEALAEAAEFMLRAVGRIAGRAGLRGVVEPGGRNDRVAIPSAEAATRFRRAIRLTPNDLVELGGEGWRTWIHSLIYTGTPSEVDWDGHDGSLSRQPFFSTKDGGLLLAIPGMAVPAIDRFLRSSLAARSIDGASLRDNALWVDIERSMRLMRIRPEESVDASTKASRRPHRVFRIDEEQLASVVLITGGSESETSVAAARQELIERGGDHVVIVLFAPEPDTESFFGLDAPPAGISELLMKPEELSTFARVEAGDPRSLADFAKASSTIREETRVLAWCAIDEFAIYRDHQSSYYLSDSGPPTLLSVASGSALKLRIEAERRSEEDLVLSPSGRPTVVMRRWEGHDGVWGPTTPYLAQGALVARTDPPIWVLTPPFADVEPSLVAGWVSVIEAVAYWIWEARDILDRILQSAGLPHAIVAIEGIDTWSTPSNEGNDGVIRIRLVEADHVVRLRLERRFAELAEAPDNAADRQLLSAIVEGLARLTNYTDIEEVAAAFDEVAPLGQKKMVIVLDVNANPDIGPNDVPRWRRVRDAPASVVLDQLGLELRQRGWLVHGEAVAIQPSQLLNDAVTVLLAMLGEETQEFDPSLLDALLIRNEAVLRERADAGFHLIPRLECFPSELAEAQKRVEGIDAASVAGRFLLEYVAAQPPTGDRVPSMGALDRLMAIADALIVRGHASDLEHLGLATTNARMLASGRLGLDDRVMSAAWHAFSPSVQLGRADDARESFMSRWRPESKHSTGDLEALDRASLAEWGYSFSDFGRVISAAVSLSISAGDPVHSLPAAAAAEQLALAAEVTSDIATAVVKQLTLEPRSDYLAPPTGFGLTDLYPWRYNRGLLLLRRPFILRIRNGMQELVFGRRALLESLHYLLELIESSRLRPRSLPMAEYIGQKSLQRGVAFNDRVANELSALLEAPVRRRVTKLRSVQIADERGPLGDIDVLAADRDRRTVWVVECKSLAPSRTPTEVANELLDLHGEDGSLGHIGKHTRLVEWLKAHHDLLAAELSLDGDWRVEGLFVVDDDLYGPYFRPAPVPVIPLRRLREFVRPTVSND